jgi:hypothetical protein
MSGGQVKSLLLLVPNYYYYYLDLVKIDDGSRPGEWGERRPLRARRLPSLIYERVWLVGERVRQSFFLFLGGSVCFGLGVVGVCVYSVSLRQVGEKNTVHRRKHLSASLFSSLSLTLTGSLRMI